MRLFKNIGSIKIIKSLVYGMPLLFKILFRAKKMTQTWKVRDYHQYLNTPLNEIRRAHGLTLLEYSDSYSSSLKFGSNSCF